MDAIERALEILGLGPDATAEDIKQAYRDLAKVWHPDRFEKDPRVRRKAEEKLKEINGAYELLQSYDPESRGSSRPADDPTARPKPAKDQGRAQAPKQESSSPPSEPSRKENSAPSRKPGIRLPRWAYIIGAILAILIFGYLMEVPKKVTVPPNGSFIDEFDGQSLGDAFGITYTPALNGKGAVFSREKDSRIQYSQKLPREGTLEWWVNIDSGYHYDNFRLVSGERCAQLFTTDIHGGDVTWPGSTWLTVCDNGDLTLNMAVKKYNEAPHQVLKVTGSLFRFGEWHAIGISYGSQGQELILDGSLVGSEKAFHQELGSGGNHQAPVDLPTIGQSVSSFWKYHQYEGGFDGIVRRFRASTKQSDWLLAKASPTGEKTNKSSLSPSTSLPDLRGFVNDNAGLFSPESTQELEHRLKAFEQKGSAQIVVLTIPSLAGENIEEYSLKVANAWGIGQRGVDNGVVITVAKQERKIRIEVGRGLEGKLTNFVSARIIDRDITPRFKKGDFDGGISAGVTAIMTVIKGAVLYPTMK